MRKIIDFLDNEGLGDLIDTISDRMAENPASILTLTFLIFVVVFGLLGLILTMLIGGVIYIKYILMFIAAMFLLLTLAVFYIFFGIGWVLAHIWLVAGLVAKAVALFLVTYILAIGMTVGVVVVISLISFVVVKIVSSSKTLTNFFGFKLNGYQAARKDNKKRRKDLAQLNNERMWELQKEKEELQKAKARGKVPYSIRERISMFFGRMFLAIGRGLSHFFVARTKTVKGGSYRVMTGFGVIWETLKSLKQGVCPIVEIVDENEEVQE